MNRMIAFKTELGEHSASESIASNGYSRLKRRPRSSRSQHRYLVIAACSTRSDGGTHKRSGAPSVMARSPNVL